MRHRIISLLVVCFLFGVGWTMLLPAGAYTDVDADISTNTTWDLAGSPYHIKQNITVNLAATLSVDPGVVVKFDENTHITVLGTLDANGVEGDPITFTSNTSTQDSWEGIHFHGVDLSLGHLIVEYATQGFRLNQTRLALENATFRQNGLDMFFENNSNTSIHGGQYNSSRLIFHDDLSELVEEAKLSFSLSNPVKGPMVCDLTIFSMNGQYFNSTPQESTWSSMVTVFRQNITGPDHSWNPYNVTIYEPLTPKYYYLELNLSELGDHHFDMDIFIDPYLEDFPRYANLVEEIRYDLWVQSGDPDNSTADLYVWSTAEFIEIYPEAGGKFHFMIYVSDPIGTVDHATVYITDFVNTINYSLQLNITLKNDMPVIHAPDFVDIVEDEPASVNISFTDEDDPVGSLNLTVSHPYASYNSTTSQLEMLFPDDRYGTIIYLNCTDQKGYSVKPVFVNLTQLEDLPRLNQTLPDVVIDEEGSFELNLSQYIVDDDWGDTLTFGVGQENLDLFMAYIVGGILHVEARPDVWGTAFQKIYATDSTNNTFETSMSITIQPLPDRPTLTNHQMSPQSGNTNTNFRFKVKYTDPDDEPPAYLWLVVDGKPVNITAYNGSSDFYNGVWYVYDTSLGPGDHNLYFQVLDLAFAPIKTGNLSVTGITNAILSKIVTNGSIELRIYYTGETPTVLLTRPNDLELKLPEGFVDMNVSFTFTGVPKSQFKYAFVYIGYRDLDLGYLTEDTLRLVDVDTQGNIGEINNSGPHKDMGLVITNVSAQGTYALIADIDYDSDYDGDGYSHSNDAFPFDPLEWRDTDGDGIGDEADTDDDDDGYNDTLEENAGSDPRDADSVPPDTDGDGLIDLHDLDDDNDGMPDDWELANNLDPLDATDASKDPDGDGATNLEEYEAGTDPWRSDMEGDGEPLLTSTEVWILVLAVLLIGIFIIVLLVIRRMQKKEEEGVEDEDEYDEDDDDDWDFSSGQIKARPRKQKGKRSGRGKKKAKKKRAKKKDVMDWDEDDEMDLEESANEAELTDDEIEDEPEEDWEDETEEDGDIGDDENLVDDADIDADENDMESFECSECGEILPMSTNKCPSCKTEYED